MVRKLYPSEHTLSLVIDPSGRLKLEGTFNALIDSLHVLVDGIEQSLSQLLMDTDLEEKVNDSFEQDLASQTPVVDDDYWHHVVLIYKPNEPLYIGLDPDLYFGGYPDINEGRRLSVLRRSKSIPCTIFIR